MTGEIKEVNKPDLLVQTWQPKMPGWPSDHYGTMRLALKQGESSTKGASSLFIQSALTDVQPNSRSTVYQQARKAISRRPSTRSTSEGELIARGADIADDSLKQMGFVLSSSSRSFSTPSSSSSRSSRPKRRKVQAASTSTGISTSQILGGAAVVGLGAVLFGLVWGSMR